MGNYIYKITNEINNKVYVGKTKDFVARKSDHLHSLRNNSHHNSHIQNSFNKYGESAFSFEIIGYFTEKINEKEKEYIELYNSLDPSLGYNIKEGGEGGLHSLETKIKMSKSHSNKIFSKKHRISIRNSKRGLSLFGFTGAQLEKDVNPEKKCWRCYYNYKSFSKYIGNFIDPLTCQLIRDLIYESIEVVV
jgi:group I intron endonuclease